MIHFYIFLVLHFLFICVSLNYKLILIIVKVSVNAHRLRKWAIGSSVQFPRPGQWAGIINNTIRYKKEFNEVPSDGFHSRSHIRSTHANNSLTSIISLAIQNAARPRAMNHGSVLRAGWLLEVRVLELLDGVGEVQHLGVELPDQRLQLVHGVQHLHALRVRVETHLEGSRHGRHPASVEVKGGLVYLLLILHYTTY